MGNIITTERLGSRPQERSIPEEQSLDNGTCPELLKTETTDHTAISAIGTVVALTEVAVTDPYRNAYERACARVAAGEKLSAVVVTTSTVLDAALDIRRQFGENPPAVMLGFPIVDAP